MGEQIRIKCSVFESIARNGSTALSKLVKANNLPIRLSYDIAKLIKNIARVSATYSEKRRDLVTKYCAKDEAGKPIYMEDGKFIKILDIAAFEKEMNELLAIEEDLEMDKITLDLETFPDGILSPGDINQLGPFIIIKE